MLVAKRKALHLPADSHSLRGLYYRAAAPHPQGDHQCLPSSHQAYPGVFRRYRDERHRRTGGARVSGKDEGSREEQAYHRKCAGRHLLHLFLLVRGVPRHQQSGAAGQAALRDAVWPPERTHRRTAHAHQHPPRGLRLLGVAVRVYGAADGRGQRPALAGCGPGCGYDHPDAGDALV